MRRVLEAIFRHGRQILALLLVPLLIASVVVLAQPRVYEASATLFALGRYTVIGATGAETDLNATPAQTLATALTELLQSRSFSLSVANDTHLASTMAPSVRSDKNKLDDALYAEVSHNVKATPIGFDLFQITYDNKDPQIAKQVVTEVVHHFGVTASQFSVAEGRQLLQVYQDQLKKAQAGALTAAQTAMTYLSSHPNATAQNDPVYGQLLNQAQDAQTSVRTIQSNITQLNQQLASVTNNAEGLYLITDPPSVDSRPVSRTRNILLGGGIGLAVGLLAISIYLVILLRRDHTSYVMEDVQRATSLPVLLELPALPEALMGQRTLTGQTSP